MDQVQIGDKVLVASTTDLKSTFYSAVMVSPHATNSLEARFIQLATESGKSIKMTADHLVMSGICGSTLALVQADTVQVGACLATVSGEDVVSAVSVVAGKGIYTVVTKHDGLLIVNGIVASPFAVNHLVANSFYNIVRFVYNVMPQSIAEKTSILSLVIGAFGDVITGVFA